MDLIDLEEKNNEIKESWKQNRKESDYMGNGCNDVPVHRCERSVNDDRICTGSPGRTDS